jgi:predicted helicase
LNLYEENADKSGLNKVDGLSNIGETLFRKKYGNDKINKEDIFFYVYGLMHSNDYRERFRDNLIKALPRVPQVKTENDFWLFSKAGRLLSELHLTL